MDLKKPNWNTLCESQELVARLYAISDAVNDSERMRVMSDKLIKLYENEAREGVPHKSKDMFGIIYGKNSFRHETFMDKRFRRYVEKVRDAIRSKVLAKTDANNLDVEYMAAMVALANLVYRLGDTAPGVFQLTAGTIMRECSCESLLFRKDLPISKQLKASIEQQDQKDEPLMNEWIDFAKEELQNAVIDHLSLLLAKGENISTANYMQFIPDEADAFHIFRQTAQQTYYDIERFWIKKYFHDLEEGLKKSFIEENEDKMRLLKERLTELNTKVREDEEQKKFLLPTMKRLKEEAQKGTEAQAEIYNETLKEKDREIRSLEKKLKAITDKYMRLKESDPAIEPLPEVAEPIFDPNKRYLFVMHDWPDMINQLAAEFPNMRLMENSGTPISPNTDLVIFMTMHISHSLYYTAKDQCQTLGIPYIHFASSNMDRLKTEISKKLG